jgi:aryl-alcohol dehydrogenase-like predicted oxidoreductase
MGAPAPRLLELSPAPARAYIPGMNKSTFGKTGLQVSPLGFGAAPIGFLKTDQQRVAAMLNFMLDSGANLIDTAAMYEGSEEVIGRAVGHRRKEFVLVSKCGTRVADVPGGPFSAELIRGTVDRALRRLRTEALDVMLLHSCDKATLEKGEALAELVKARQAGKVKFVGYSGDNDAAAYAANLPDVAVIETSVSIADQANIDAVLPLARKNNIGVLAKRPIANAAWKEPQQQPGMYQGYAGEYTRRLRLMKITPAELGFAGPAEQAWPEIALRFTLSQPGVGCAIIGTTRLENMKANIGYAEKGPPPAQVVAKIREAFAKAQQAAGARWVGQQ